MSIDTVPIAEKPKPRVITSVAGGCLVILYPLLCVVMILLGRNQYLDAQSPDPTATVIPTSTPHLLIPTSASGGTVLHEMFKTNDRDWGLFYRHGKIEVINDKLILQSNVKGTYAIGTSPMVAPESEHYYVQADFSTDMEHTFPYGMIFGLNRSLSTFYMFEISPVTQGFQLLKYNAGGWTSLVPYTPHELSPYPAATTLGVKFDQGQIELFINGEQVSTHTDSDFFQSKDVGVFVSNVGYRLFVDNFFVYEENNE